MTVDTTIICDRGRTFLAREGSLITLTAVQRIVLGRNSPQQSFPGVHRNAIMRRSVRAILAAGALLVIAGCAALEPAPALDPVAVRPTPPTETLLRMADQIYAGGDRVTAVALYRQAVSSGGDDPRALVRLGDALAATGELSDAAGAYRAAMMIAPDDLAALKGLVRTQLAQGQVEQALEPLARGRELAPGDLQLLMAQGVTYDLLGQADLAQRTYREGLNVEPRQLSLKANLALSLALAGQLDEALRLSGEISAAPDATPFHRRAHALVLALAGRSDAARTAQRAGLSRAEAERLVNEAQAVRRLDDHRTRARAVGALIVNRPDTV